MSEEKKTTQEEKKVTKTVTKREPRYGIEEFVEACKDVRSDVVRAALRRTGRTDFEEKEGYRIIKDYRKKEIR